MSYRSSNMRSKWVKTKWLLKQPSLRKHVPHTKLFTKKNLSSMLTRYATVFFKPSNGSGGSNVIRIKRKRFGYQSQLHTVKTRYATKEKLYRKLKAHAKRRSYVLQKGVQLARTNGNPFDIRVMVQKTNAGRWISTGVFSKIGKPGKVATNYNQGGRVDFFTPTMKGAGYKPSEIHRKERQLKRLGVAVGNNFTRHIKGFRELGLDVALDNRGRMWILEVNTSPQFYPLKGLKDKTLYRRILSFAKQYGRRK